MAFSVLFVCTGNICRSPTAERLLTARLPAGVPIAVASAGTRALVGHGMDTPSLIALRELGGDSSGHAGQSLTGALVGSSDLILTAESAHRTQIVQANPIAFRKTFTMREFARLGDELEALTEPDELSLRARVGEVAGRRGWIAPAGPGADEIGDPFGGPLKLARACAAQIAGTVDGIIAALGLPHR